MKKLKYTFFGIPHVKLYDVTNRTIALLGSTILTKSIHSPCGINKAADVIRKASIEYTGFLSHLDIEIHERDVVDLGNFSRENIGRAVMGVLENGGIPIVIGGDHATTYYTLSEVELSPLLWLDAHLDFALKTFHGERINDVFHGNVLRLLVEKHNLETTIAGFRGYSTFGEELKSVQKLGIKLIFAEETTTERLKKLIEEHVAVSLDVDFFDATYFNAARVPELCGMKPSDLIIALRNINHSKVRYFDIVEYCPRNDIGYVHAKILSQIILEIIGMFIKMGYG